MKIGILIQDSLMLEAWQLLTVNKLAQSAFCSEIVYVIAPHKKKQRSLPLLLNLYLKFENIWFRRIENAFKRTDVRQLVHKHHTIRIPETGHLSAESQKAIVDLDLVYGFDDGRYQTQLNIAKYGYWKIHFGSSIPAYEEVMKNHPVVESKLNVYLPDGIRNIYHGVMATIPFSIKHSRQALAWKSSEFILFRLNELSQLGSQIFFSHHPVSVNTEPINVPVPGNGTVIFHLLINTFRYFRYKIKKKESSWNFRLYYKPGIFTPDDFKLKDLQVISVRSAGFEADPFVVFENGVSHIFFEDYNAATGKAHISVISIDAAGNISDTVKVLEKDYHLSYPFIFYEKGKWYLIPESSENRTVDLYQAENFPFKWKFVRHLMKDIVLRDSTLIQHGGRWWLFASSTSFEFDSGNDQLFLYSTDDLFSSDWIPHPQNPVATDISNCRPAGKIFYKEGKMYRPAQNNASKQYGFGLNINLILELNEHSYREQVVFKITPSKDNSFKAVHTINFNDDITVIDGIQ